MDSSSVVEKDINQLKKELYDSLFDGIVDAMLHGSATITDGRESANFILARMNKINDKDQLLQFLFDLSTKWAVYNPYYVKIKYAYASEEDAKKVKELKSKLYTFIQPK